MSKRRHTKYGDLIFTFKFACIDFVVNEETYSTDDCKQIRQILSTLTREITIDKSYVDFKDNRHDKVFMTEYGWNALCKLAIDTRRKATQKQNDTKIESYSMIILSYLYQALEDFGYDTDEIYLEVAEDSYFMVEFEYDETSAWKSYPGKWQSWKWFKD